MCQVFGLVSAKKLDKTTGVCFTFNGNGAQDRRRQLLSGCCVLCECARRRASRASPLTSLPRSRGRVWRASHMAHKRPSSGVAEKCDKLLTNGKCPGVNGSPTFILVDSDKKSLSKFDVAYMDLHAATAHVYPSWMFQAAASGRQKHCCESLNRNDINYLIS